MSDKRFIKLIDSEEVLYLIEHHPNAFLLLTLIALRARRVSGKPDGLIIGDSILGDHKSAGLSRQQYRTALQKLVELGHIEIVYNGKRFLKREKSTIKITINSTLVNLCKSTIYDINPETTNHHDNQRATNEQPTSNHKEERIRMNKKEKEKNKKKEKPLIPEKVAFKEFVFLTESEHAKLLALHGQQKLERMLDILNSYKGRTGATYKSDYYAMDAGSWVVAKASEQNIQRLNGKYKPVFSEGENRMYAEEISRKYYKSGEEIGIDNESIYFLDTISQQAKPIAIKFRDPKFEELVIHELKKRQFEEIPK
jgi:hypothetical protein